MSIFRIRLTSLKYIRCYTSNSTFINKDTSADRIKLDEQLMINKLLTADEKIDDKQWISIRDELIGWKKSIKQYNVDMVIMDTCCNYDKIDAALNYIKFLKINNYEINLATIGKYFRLLHARKKKLSLEEIETAHNFYDNIRSKYSTLDSNTAASCLSMLSMTERWKEGEELLKMMEEVGGFKCSAHNTFASVAFDYNDSDKGWKNIKSMGYKMMINPQLHESYLNFCIRNANNPNELEILLNKMFVFWSENNITPESNIIGLYTKCLENSGKWSVKTAKVYPNGSCTVCGEQLTSTNLTKEEFEYLAKKFLSNVLVGKDVYQNTTPVEFQNFIKFVQSTKPYDVVIDGLNVDFMGHHKMHSKGDQLANLVKIFVKQNKKLFILGRKHMRNWSKSAMNYVEQNSYLFLANDISRDDVFLLYAALSSGINTFFCSRDFMRQHKWLLGDPKSQKIFHHWQFTRQIVPTCINTRSKSQLSISYPSKLIPVVQQTSQGGWHFPYNQTDSKKEIQINHQPKSWICCRKLPNSP